MAEWIYTNVLHEPRKALGISVLEYCVLDYIYKTQTHPIYGKNGWTNAGCHRVAAFFDLSSGTVKKLFDRMDEAGLLERVANDMKRVTEKFYSIAYESDVQKVNDYRLQIEQQGVQKVNSDRSKSEQYNKRNVNTEYKLKEKGLVETSSTAFLDLDEIEDIEQQIYHSKTTEKKEKKSVARKRKESADDPTPIRAMWQEYEKRFADLNQGEPPVFHKKYLRSLKTLFGVLRERTIKKSIVPLNDIQPWCDFLDMAAQHLKNNPKETYLRGRFDPIGIEAEFNKWITTLNNRPKTDAEKWIEWGKRQGL